MPNNPLPYSYFMGNTPSPPQSPLMQLASGARSAMGGGMTANAGGGAMMPQQMPPMAGSQNGRLPSQQELDDLWAREPTDMNAEMIESIVAQSRRGSFGGGGHGRGGPGSLYDGDDGSAICDTDGDCEAKHGVDPEYDKWGNPMRLDDPRHSRNRGPMGAGAGGGGPLQLPWERMNPRSPAPGSGRY